MTAIRASLSQKRELARLTKLADRDIDVSDIPEVTDWSKAETGRFYRPRKQIVTIRLDADVLDWFRARSEKYQTAVNQVLRDHMIRGTRRP